MKARDTVIVLIGYFTQCIGDIIEVCDDDNAVKVDINPNMYPSGVWYDKNEVKVIQVFRALPTD